jgi:hypothetical protein
MANTYDPGTDIGKVRLFCQDRGLNGTWIFSDEEIQAYLSLESNDIRLAAALALEDIANNKALTDKVKQVGDIQLVTGVDMAKTLMSRAEALRSSVENSSVFGVADYS